MKYLISIEISKWLFTKQASRGIFNWNNNKKYLTIFFSIIAIISFGQSNYQDAVYLKNGSVIRGVIIEQVPNKSIKIEMADKSVFVYQIEEIEKITKETIEIKKSERRKGFIGLSLGASIPTGIFADELDGAANTGIQINLVNVGYLFSKNVGITGVWFVAANPTNIDFIDPWSYGGMMVGPLISFPITKKVDWDLRPMVGYSVTTLPDLGYGTEQAISIAINIGTVFRINVSKRISLLLSADFFSTKPDFVEYGFDQNINTISLGFGVAYRLK